MTKKVTNIYIICFIVLCVGAIIAMPILDCVYDVFNYPNTALTPLYFGFAFCALALIYYLTCSKELAKVFKILDIILTVLLFVVLGYTLYGVIRLDVNRYAVYTVDAVAIYGTLMFWVICFILFLSIYHYLSLYNLFDKSSKKKMLTPFATKIFMIVLTVAILLFILIKGWHRYLFDFDNGFDHSDVNETFFHDQAIGEVFPMFGLLPISFLALFGTTKFDIKWKVFDAFLHIFMFVASQYFLLDISLFVQDITL